MEKKTIEPAQEDIDNIVEDVLKSESPTEKAWREMEEQMASPEGLEGIKIPNWAKAKNKKKEKKKADLNEVEKRQALLTEFRKWENNYSPGIVGLEYAYEETPAYLDADVKFDNQNNFFDFPITFMDYLVDNALDGSSEEFANKIKNTIDELEEIIFYDIFVSGEKLWLDLKSSDGNVRLQFKAKYPFQYEGGSLNFE